MEDTTSSLSQKEEPLPETSEIKRLDEDTVRRITAEQAISDLQSIVKELMDNALDAESTTIKIRLFGQGLEIIEVSDDGNGVPVGSRPYMATRHATSKIERLEDIYEGTGLTMGFRGEALFAMACVSDSLVVASRTEDDELATKLVFGKDGKPIDNSEGGGAPLARKVGTTVAVVKPFGNLPARRADLVRRIKQERTRIFKLVESYGIFNVGVCFRLIDINGPQEAVALATSASSTTLQETASTLLGPAFLKGTTSLEVCLESFLRSNKKKKPSPNRGAAAAAGGGSDGGENDDEDDICYNWGIRGLISVKPSLIAATQQQPHRRSMQRRGGSFGGVSSSSMPRQPASRVRIVQYYSINGRVVELPKVTALLKRLWGNFASAVVGLKQKKPSAILEFTLPNDAFDINLSPDKQTVLLTHEEEILRIIEEHVIEMWSDEASSVFVDNSLSQIQQKEQQQQQQEQQQQQQNRSRDRYGTAVSLNDTVPSSGNALHEKEGEKKSREYYGYENDEDETQKHRRRFAFVHDISKAKMQHDMSERRASDENENFAAEGGRPPLIQTKLTPVVQTKPPSQSATSKRSLEDASQSESQTETQSERHPERHPEHDPPSPSKRLKATTEMDSQTETSSSPTYSRIEKESPRYQSPEDKVSDFERQKWTEIQSKFSRDNDSDHASNCESLRRPQHEIASIPSKGPVTPEDSTYRSHSGGAISSSRSRRGNLQQFAFQSSTETSSDGDPNDRYRRNKQSSMPPPDERPSTRDGERNNKISNDTATARLNRKRKDIDENQSIPLPVADSDCRLQNNRISKEIEQTEMNSKADERDPETNSDENPPKQVVWGCFSSTKDICLSSRIERLDMRKRKREIDLIRRRIRDERNATNPVKKENERRGHSGISKTLDNEIDKKIGFDDDGDGNEDDSGFIRMPKSTFRSGMQVIGQFNLGFILARCSRNHLWILDQHASDEQYNYEQLYKNTVMHQQPLISPLRLELTPSEEACVLDHMDIFEANGFRFNFDDQAPIRHRLSLTALPHSGAHEGRKAVQFGPSDVSTLCSILTEGSSYDAGSGGTGTDGSGTYGNNAVRRNAGTVSSSNRSDRLLARLPRAIAMFASRACRTSIMIGDALSHKEMNSVVQKLANVDAPWNCPHGRPTMRHVANVLPMVLKDERKAAEHIAVPTITVVPTQEEEDN